MSSTSAIALRSAMFARIGCDPGTQTLRGGARPNRGTAQSRFLISAPQHRDRSRQTSAHVESQITFRVRNLSLPGLLGQMLISFEHLPDTSRAHRMTISD